MLEETFHFKLENNKILRAITDTLSSIIDECIIEVSPAELQINAMDPSRICLLRLTMKRENFDAYECKKGMKIPLNLDDFNKILKRSNSDDYLELDYNSKDKKVRLQMTKEGTTKKRNFSLATIDIEQEDIPMENLLKIDYSTKFNLELDLLSEALKDAEIYSEVLTLLTSEESLTLSSSGQIGEMEYVIAKEDLGDLIATLETKETGSFSLLFLKTLMKLAPITEQLKVSFKQENPLRLDFSLLEGNELAYFLAPRVEEVDFEDGELEEGEWS